MDMLVVRTPYMPYQPFACIYKIKFGLGRYYIGATVDLDERIDAHLSNIRRGKRDIKDYISIIDGRFSILFEVLEEVADISKLQEREQHYIDQHYEDKYCLNKCKISSIHSRIKHMLEEV